MSLLRTLWRYHQVKAEIGMNYSFFVGLGILAILGVVVGFWCARAESRRRRRTKEV